MAAYRADIEIAVRGARELDQLIKTTNRLNNSINVVNRNAKLLQGKNFNVANIENYSRAVSKAERAVRKAAEGTDQERTAITKLVSAMELENKARQRKNILIAQEVANRRRVQATIDAGFGIQGPQAAPIRAGRGPTSPIGGATFIPGSPAALRAGARGTTSGGGTATNRFGGVASNAIIGGAFPLLFGQGGGAATGGAIGGAVGGLFGGAGGFAGSLLGTLIGDITSQGAKIKQLGEDIGFSAEQTKILEGAFARAGREAEKFEAAVQNIRGLGLSLEDQADAINLAARLTEQYGGRIDKVAAAYADFVEKGKVGIADINKFTAQGVPILEQLEKKFGTNRDGVLALAKDGKISAQELSDALVQIAQTSDAVNKKVKTGWDKVWSDLGTGASMSVRGIAAVFSSLVGSSANVSGDIASLFSGLYRRMIEGALDAGARISRILAATARAAANYAATFELGGLNIGATAAKGAAKGAEDIFTNLDKQLQQIRNTPVTKVGNIEVPGQAPDSGRTSTGKKPPEDRTAQLREEFQAIVAIGQAEDRIRDLRFQGRDILAAQAEFDKQLADIQRDKNKALIQANYESERIVITKIAEARTVKATLELEDQIREIEKQRADAYEAVLRGPKEEIRLIDARIAGKEREIEIELRIEELKRDQIHLGSQQLEQYRQQLELLYQRRDAEEVFNLEQQVKFRGAGLQAGFVGPAGAAFEQQLTEGKSVERATQIAQLTQQLQLVDVQAQAIESSILGIGDAFGEAMTSGVAALVSGTQNAQQVFAAFLNTIGQTLVQAASQMIATYVAIGIARIFAGLGGGGGEKGLNFGDMKKYSMEGPISAGMFGGRAGGGAVSAQRPYMVGERGPELFVPGTGGSVVPNNDLRAAMGAAPGSSAGAPVLNMSFETSTINGVEYVSRDQLEAAMAATRRQAARDGAQRGMSMTLDRLQQSPNTRRRVGI